MEFLFRRQPYTTALMVYRMGHWVGTLTRDRVDETWYAFDLDGEYVGNCWEKQEAAELLVDGRVPHLSEVH